MEAKIISFPLSQENFGFYFFYAFYQNNNMAMKKLNIASKKCFSWRNCKQWTVKLNLQTLKITIFFFYNLLALSLLVHS